MCFRKIHMRSVPLPVCLYTRWLSTPLTNTSSSEWERRCVFYIFNRCTCSHFSYYRSVMWGLRETEMPTRHRWVGWCWAHCKGSDTSQHTAPFLPSFLCLSENSWWAHQECFGFFLPWTVDCSTWETDVGSYSGGFLGISLPRMLVLTCRGNWSGKCKQVSEPLQTCYLWA